MRGYGDGGGDGGLPDTTQVNLRSQQTGEASWMQTRAIWGALTHEHLYFFSAMEANAQTYKRTQGQLLGCVSQQGVSR